VKKKTSLFATKADTWEINKPSESDHTSYLRGRSKIETNAKSATLYGLEKVREEKRGTKKDTSNGRSITAGRLS